MNVTAFGTVIRAYRKASGISQKELARMGGISRATLNYLESGREIEIGAGKLFTLLDLLGIRLELASEPDVAADESTVGSTIDNLLGAQDAGLPRDVLMEALASGRIPKEFRAQFTAYLDQAPDEAVLATIRSAARHADTSPRAIWKNARSMAKALDSQRPIWQHG